MTFMKWRFSRSASVGLGSFVAIFLSLGCLPDANGVEQECDYSTSTNWPIGGTFSPGNPASCPVITPPGGRSQDYDATAEIPAVRSTGVANLSFLNRHGNLVTQSTDETKKAFPQRH